MTPSIHITPEKIAIMPITHRHPSDSARKPPAIGPIVGPRKGARAKSPMARPRSDALNISAICPPALVRGDDPNAPAKNLKTRSVCMFCEPALAALKAVKPP